jgi:hypothetical protein
MDQADSSCEYAKNVKDAGRDVPVGFWAAAGYGCKHNSSILKTVSIFKSKWLKVKEVVGRIT